MHETSIYRRWGNRERLALEAATELSASRIPAPDTGSIREDLIELGRSLVEYLETPLGQALARMMASSTDDGALALARAEFWHERRRESAAMIERAVARGELTEATDAAMMIECFVGPVHFRSLLTREPVDDAYLAHFADIAIAASRPAGR